MVVDDRDHLTRLLTRSAFDTALAARFTEATSARPASLVMADIDHFKKVNDGHGHQVGDAVLTEVARRVSGVVESKGLAYRYGGEELAVILPNHSAEEALAVAERIRLAVGATQISGLSVTCSLGVAIAPVQSDNIADWLSKADMALYDAKHLGRNLVRLSGEPPPEAATSRKPVRRTPEPGTISDEAKEALRLQILKRGRAICPFDEIPLDHHDITSMQETGRSFIAYCPGCGFNVDLPGPGRK